MSLRVSSGVTNASAPHTFVDELDDTRLSISVRTALQELCADLLIVFDVSRYLAAARGRKRAWNSNLLMYTKVRPNSNHDVQEPLWPAYNENLAGSVVDLDRSSFWVILEQDFGDLGAFFDLRMGEKADRGGVGELGGLGNEFGHDGVFVGCWMICR